MRSSSRKENLMALWVSILIVWVSIIALNNTPALQANIFWVTLSDPLQGDILYGTNQSTFFVRSQKNIQSESLNVVIQYDPDNVTFDRSSLRHDHALTYDNTQNGLIEFVITPENNYIEAEKDIFTIQFTNSDKAQPLVSSAWAIIDDQFVSLSIQKQ